MLPGNIRSNVYCNMIRDNCESNIRTRCIVDGPLDAAVVEPSNKKNRYFSPLVPLQFGLQLRQLCFCVSKHSEIVFLMSAALSTCLNPFICGLKQSRNSITHNEYTTPSTSTDTSLELTNTSFPPTVTNSQSPSGASATGSPILRPVMVRID